MDLNTAVLFGVVALLGSHQLVRWVGYRSGLLWTLSILDVLVGSAILWFGLPGFEATPMVNWVLGLLLFLHVATNMQQHGARQEAERAAAREERDQERRARRD